MMANYDALPRILLWHTNLNDPSLLDGIYAFVANASLHLRAVPDYLARNL